MNVALARRAAAGVHGPAPVQLPDLSPGQVQVARAMPDERAPGRGDRRERPGVGARSANAGSSAVMRIGALVLLVGCATNRVDWNARVGNYTYQQAVLDMGPPDRQAKLEDGTTVLVSSHLLSEVEQVCNDLT